MSGYITTGPRAGSSGTSSYSALLARIKAEGLLRRRTGWYWGLIGVLTGLLVLAGTAFAVLGDAWWQLIVAAVLGLVFTQFAFLAHEAAHRQVFASHHWNDRAARYVGTFLTGVSYAWWTNKHTRHHANPNTVGKDPDISFDAISFRPEDAASRTGFLRVLVRVQGYAFFPMLLVEGANLHWQSIRTYTSGKGVKRRWAEGSVFFARFVLYLGAVFWFLPLGMAFAFVGVQLAVFGFCMGIAFAPNHKGMPIIEPGQRVDFFSRQVLTSRDITGGVWVEYFMGGLNHQVEHHLFPNMARPNLRAARVIVREYCATQGVPFTETTMVRSYAIVVRYLNEVGLAAADPFACPMVERYR
ncbi:fatty acid desaturase [Curtobacterium sp. PhB130]|uniref:fatty acid desaturase family protein n=1 Tax=unclassified Curtobacterium TaxID=257496 RepID=UPI000F4B2124|nr:MULTISPECIES: acyl-CoA desaturase [unclassified Curtobacterium]ROS75738.1 fatty acid desaturase [Curtobacterium sp. PhB130]TCK64527.1 fatty acid desaturase [Curtobacterium sp. PhB136]